MASRDVELAFGAVLGLVVRMFANDVDVQFGTILLLESS